MKEKLYRHFAIVCIGAATPGVLGRWLLFYHPINCQSEIISAMQESEANAKKSAIISTLFEFTPFPYDFTLEAVKKTHDIITAN